MDCRVREGLSGLELAGARPQAVFRGVGGFGFSLSVSI
jgi:hypothetical protein